MRRKFYTLDVFTDTPFAGNPLAVVRDAQGLDAARMQAIAREFNLSETVFLLPARDPVNTARARIFTPTRELPFAGHPTVGAAVLIGLLDAPHMIAGRDLDVVLEEEAGDVRCTVRKPPVGAARARFVAPRLPERVGEAPDAAAVARALSLAPEDIGFDRHVPSVFSAGVGFTFVPLASRDAVTRARPDMAHWGALGPADHPAAYVYCREAVDPANHIHTRMFAPSLGVPEDPATGAAAAAFAGVCMAYETPDDGEHVIVIEQGYAMGRPSRIVLGLVVEGGALREATIGGSATLVMQGEIDA
ncbi:MAG TPA: PhzF family phenazine biosynthesis protein [Beijerinckiaceae bacterium]|jgi:trans-2,3-dihydro-3-hydroxyanthranilate isomerase